MSSPSRKWNEIRFKFSPEALERVKLKVKEELAKIDGKAKVEEESPENQA